MRRDSPRFDLPCGPCPLCPGAGSPCWQRWPAQGEGLGKPGAATAGPLFPPLRLLSQVLAQREPWQLENSPNPTAALGFGEGRRRRGAAPPPRRAGDPRGRAGGFSQLLQRCWRDLLARGGNQIPCPAAGGARGPAPRRADPPRHTAGEPGRGSVHPRIVWAAPSDTSAGPPDPQGCAVSPIYSGDGIQSPPRHPCHVCRALPHGFNTKSALPEQ